MNGPGEAALTEIGVTGGGNQNHMLYINGNQINKISTNDMIEKIVSLVEQKDKKIKAASQVK